MALSRTLLLLAGALAAPALAGPLSNEDFVLAHYPKVAYERGEEGIVGFRIELDRKNRVMSCVVTESSGYTALDTGTCDVMLEFARVKAPDTPDRTPIKSYEGSLDWKLPNRAKQLIVDVPSLTRTTVITSASMSKEKVTCRMSNKIDTWYVMVRECHTNADWRRAEEMAKATTALVQNAKGGMQVP